jgi:uncharacterized protein
MLAGIRLARHQGRISVMEASLGRVMRIAIGAGVGAFVTTAGRVLESDRLPPAEHRPWALPHEPWVMAQSWRQALFAHWRLRPVALRRFLPAGLALDTFGGAAWLGITAFVVAGARLRGLPAVPGLSTFAEVNVRTYVTADDKPGVLFLSLDAASVGAVLGARAWFRLPYFLSAAEAEWRAGRMRFNSRRTHPGAPPARFSARSRPARGRLAGGEALTRWLLERYCLYCGADGTLLRAEIHHQPWPVEPAEAVIDDNTLADGLGLHLGESAPLTHFSSGVDAVIWPPRVVERPRRRVA